MDLTFLTKRYVDRSKSTGFQFEFFCDRCDTGYKTPFRIHALGVVTSLWEATETKSEKEKAKELDFNTLKKEVSKFLFKGKAWIEAYTEAMEEAQKYFKHCTHCSRWVCPKTCYNENAAMCLMCKPYTEKEKAELAAKEAAEAKRKQSFFRTEQAPAKQPEPKDTHVDCPHCGQRNPESVFCADCGGRIIQDVFCTGCGSKWSTRNKMKFCPRCGEEMVDLPPAPRAKVAPASNKPGATPQQSGSAKAPVPPIEEKASGSKSEKVEVPESKSPDKSGAPVSQIPENSMSTQDELALSSQSDSTSEKAESVKEILKRTVGKQADKALSKQKVVKKVKLTKLKKSVGGGKSPSAKKTESGENSSPKSASKPTIKPLGKKPVVRKKPKPKS